MNLTPAQSQIARDLHRFRVVNCGRRFGKTTLAILEMIAKAVSKEDQNIAFIATTYQQARDIAWRELVKLSQPAILKQNESRLELELSTIDNGKSIITLRGWESIETARGQKFHFLVLDEIASMKNFWENWQEILIPTLTDTKGEVLFLSTPKGYNHFYDLFEREKIDREWKSFHFTTYNNPTIDPQEIEKLKQQMTDDRFAQEYLASFKKMHGLVYPEFDRLVHVYDTDNSPKIERLAGVDFGFTNPTASLIIQKDYDGNYWLSEEWYKSGKTNTEVIEYVKSKQPHSVYPDPAEPDRIEEMRRQGLNVRDVSKDVTAGINKIRELLKAKRLKVHKSCVNTISEFESYSYPEKKPEHNEPEVPIKENDHAMDALRYALFMNDVVKSRHIVQQWKPDLLQEVRADDFTIANPHRAKQVYVSLQD